MSDEELVSISWYTGYGSGDLNAALRSGNAAELKRVDNFRRTLDDALRRLPDARGRMRRGADLTAAQRAEYRPGSEIVEPLFVSSSKPFRRNTRFVIHSRHGKNVEPYSQVPDESEVLFAADTRFRVLAHDRGADGKAIIEMEEID